MPNEDITNSVTRLHTNDFSRSVFIVKRIRPIDWIAVKRITNDRTVVVGVYGQQSVTGVILTNWIDHIL